MSQLLHAFKGFKLLLLDVAASWLVMNRKASQHNHPVQAVMALLLRIIFILEENNYLIPLALAMVDLLHHSLNGGGGDLYWVTTCTLHLVIVGKLL